MPLAASRRCHRQLRSDARTRVLAEGRRLRRWVKGVSRTLGNREIQRVLVTISQLQRLATGIFCRVGEHFGAHADEAIVGSGIPSP
jgi:hypothetical protein